MTARAVSTVIEASERTRSSSAARTWTGRSLTGIVAIFLFMDGAMKLFHMPVAVKATAELGYPESTVAGIGLVLIACTLLHLFPRTAGAGAVLLTGYLGGAVATHVRGGGSWFNILFPVICGTMIWGGLRLRKGSLRSLLPLAGNSGQETSRWQVWIGRVLSVLPAIFFLVNGSISLSKPPFVVEGTLQMGYPESTIIGMTLALLASTVLYLVPRTAVLGAVLLTGYLGGAVATHVRVGDPWSNILMPILFAAVIWAGLWLRNIHVRRFWSGELATR